MMRAKEDKKDFKQIFTVASFGLRKLKPNIFKASCPVPENYDNLIEAKTLSVGV